MAYEIVTWTDSTGTTQSKDINTTGVTFTGKVRKLLIQGSNTVNNTLIDNGKWYHNSNEASSSDFGNTNITIDGPTLRVTKNSSNSILCPAEYALTWKSDTVKDCTKTVTIKQKSYIIVEGKTISITSTDTSKDITVNDNSVDINIKVSNLIEGAQFTGSTYYIYDKTKYNSGIKSVIDSKNLTLTNKSTSFTVDTSKLSKGTYVIELNTEYCGSSNIKTWNLTISNIEYDITFTFSTNDYVSDCANTLIVYAEVKQDGELINLPSGMEKNFYYDYDYSYNNELYLTNISTGEYQSTDIKVSGDTEYSIDYTEALPYKFNLDKNTTKVSLTYISALQFYFVKNANDDENSKITSINMYGSSSETFYIKVKGLTEINGNEYVWYTEDGAQIFSGCTFSNTHTNTYVTVECKKYNNNNSIYKCTVTPSNNALSDNPSKITFDITATDVCNLPFHNMTINYVGITGTIDMSSVIISLCSNIKLSLTIGDTYTARNNEFTGKTITLKCNNVTKEYTLGSSATNTYNIEIPLGDFNITSSGSYNITYSSNNANIVINDFSKNITVIDTPVISICDKFGNELNDNEVSQSGTNDATFYVKVTRQSDYIAYKTGEISVAKSVDYSVVHVNNTYYTINIDKYDSKNYKSVIYKCTVKYKTHLTTDDYTLTAIRLDNVCTTPQATVSIYHTHPYDWKLQYEYK